MPTVEELQERVLELEDTLRAREDQITALEGQTREMNERITSLQEHNQRLFLRLQADEPTNEEPKEEPVPTIEDLASKYKGVIK